MEWEINFDCDDLDLFTRNTHQRISRLRSAAAISITPL